MRALLGQLLGWFILVGASTLLVWGAIGFCLWDWNAQQWPIFLRTALLGGIGLVVILWTDVTLREAWERLW